MKLGKTNSRRPRSPTQTESHMTVGCGLVRQGTYNGTEIYFHDPWFNHYIFNIK
jgi:hypothetical protein